MEKVPPSFAGARLLGQPEQQLQQPQPTKHMTEFHGCGLGIYVLLDENNVCTGYRLQIIDPREARTYIADFGQDLFEEWRSDFSKFPNVGEVPQEVQEAQNGEGSQRDVAVGSDSARVEVRDE